MDRVFIARHTGGIRDAIAHSSSSSLCGYQSEIWQQINYISLTSKVQW
jgi:hypothetical protein